MNNEAYETHIDDYQHESMVDCCLGAYPEAWYKFKRFECLSLLNLYYYQHELVRLDAEIFGTPEVPKDWKSLKGEDWLQLRTMIKEYQTAIQLFKQTAQMKRPTLEEREATVQVLKEKVRDKRYSNGHDALGMLDLGPDALNTTQDGLRAMIERRMIPPTNISPNMHLPAQKSPAQNDTTESMLPSTGVVTRTSVPVSDHEHQAWRKKSYNFRGRPLFTLPVDKTLDRFIRLVVALVAAATLLVPLVVLYKIHNPDHVILATCLFVLGFAFLVSMIGKKSTTEVMVAVATYAAVLVVFVGQTISPRTLA